jgi:hypothetical protein
MHLRQGNTAKSITVFNFVSIFFSKCRYLPDQLSIFLLDMIFHLSVEIPHILIHSLTIL